MRLNIFIGLSFITFLFCVLIRFYYPLILNSYPQYFYHQTPLLNTHDGYFYAQGAKYLTSIAQELQSNLSWGFWQNPQNFFEILHSPHLFQTPQSANEILSAITALFAFCLPFNLEQICFFLPGIFGSLIVFPMMALTRNFGIISCLLSGILSAVSVSYYNRTLFGYYDTDMLIIVLGLSVGTMILRTWKTQCALDYAILLFLSAFSLGYYANLRYILLGYILVLLLFLLKDFFQESYKESQIQRILLGLLGILTLEIFFPKLTFVWICLGFSMSFALKALRKSFKSKILFAFYLFCNLGLLLWKLLPNILQNHYLNKYFERDLRADETFHYFNVLDSIAEVSKIDLSEFAYRVSGGTIWLILGILGYFWLILAHKRFLIFLPFLVLGCFAFVQGLRFSFYAVPISALGLGFLLYQIQGILKYLKPKFLEVVFALVFAFLAILPHLWHLKNYLVEPILETSEAEILSSFPHQSNDFALAWWDYGYVIGYFSNLKTFIDGGTHSGKQNFPISLVLSSSNEILSYNIAKMLVNAESLEDYFKQNGIKTGLENLQTKRNFTKIPKDLYIILPHRMIEILPNVMRFSQINLDNGKIPKLDFFALSVDSKNEIIYFKNGISLNQNTGEVFSQDFHIKIQKSINLKNGSIQTFDAASVLIAVFLENGKTLLCAESYLESFYFKGLLEQLDSNLFQKVAKNDKIIIYKLL